MPPARPPNGSGAKDAQAHGNVQQVFDVFGVDVYAAAFALVLLLLGLMKAAMEPACTC